MLRFMVSRLIERPIPDRGSKELFVSTTFVSNGAYVGEVVESLIENGITNIELGSNHRYEADFLDQLSNMPCRFLVHNYFPIPADDFVLNIASASRSIRERSLQHIISAIDFCADIGAELYTFHPGFLSDPAGVSIHRSSYDFQFQDRRLGVVDYQKAYEQMVRGIEKAVVHAARRGVRIAIETEGSVRKKEHLIMQTPEEFERLFKHFAPDDVGVTLNIGHLNLAARAFGFRWEDLVSIVAPALSAFEMSHNYGIEDDHLPLEKEEWYWSLLSAECFRNVPKILETRETLISDILDNLTLCAGLLQHSAYQPPKEF